MRISKWLINRKTLNFISPQLAVAAKTMRSHFTIPRTATREKTDETNMLAARGTVFPNVGGGSMCCFNPSENRSGRS